jgi:Predicted metal-dependent hydrolase of the TIM-barrel fold
MDADWLPFHPEPGIPAYVPPPGAVDAHCHVFGPGALFPYASTRKYTPCDAGRDELFALRDRMGFTRSVLVQATCHGEDNRAMLDAIAHSGGRARGVASIGPDVSEDELSAMHAAGVRGVRFNYVRRLVDPRPDAFYRRLIDKIAPFGWHVVIYFEAADLAEKWDFFVSLPTIVVVDHMGRPDLSKPADGPEFGQFLRFMERGNIWSKVSCPERLSLNGPPAYDDFVPFGRAVVERFPDRVLWGSDWPHPNLNLVGHMPDDAWLVDMIPRIAPTAALQHKLLVDNPMRLYWPDI